ncbi:MAG: NAD(P)/FAD-dependent oxidoreductase [Candidatus Omnitrophota bacterium]
MGDYRENNYDVVIIGAGVGGLVCGCFLAKSGFKVMIVESNKNPGGCCVSFRRKGFVFDAGVFSLGDCDDGGKLGQIIEMLSLKEFVNLIQLDPTEVIVTPDVNVVVSKSFHSTMSAFQRCFPSQANKIEKFLEFLQESSPVRLLAAFKDYSFEELLDSYFSDDQLKLVFYTIMATFGQPSKNISAVTAAVVLKEFIVNGGYYPEGGVQKFAEGLVSVFEKMGGVIKYSCTATKILVKDNKVKGVFVNKETLINADIVISNCDASQTFLKLIDCEHLDNNFIEIIQNRIPSISSFMVFLGVGHKFNELKYKCKYWCALNSNIISGGEGDIKNDWSRIGDHLIVSFPSLYDSSLSPENKESVCILVSVPFGNKEFWIKNKAEIAEQVISKTEKIFPGLSKDIEIKEIATPLTYVRFTQNRNGAAYGWDGTRAQLTENVLSYKTPIKGLYVVGHWTKDGFGVSRAAFSGYNVSRLVSASYKKDLTVN